MLEKAGNMFLKLASRLGFPSAVLVVVFGGIYLFFDRMGVPLFERGLKHLDILDDSLEKQTGVLVDIRAAQSEEVIRAREQGMADVEQTKLLERQDASQIRQEKLLKELIEKME